MMVCLRQAGRKKRAHAEGGNVGLDTRRHERSGGGLGSQDCTKEKGETSKSCFFLVFQFSRLLCLPSWIFFCSQIWAMGLESQMLFVVGARGKFWGEASGSFCPRERRHWLRPAGNGSPADPEISG